MARMKAVQVTKSKGPFEIVERDIPEPGTGEVCIKVEACGVCHSDVTLMEFAANNRESRDMKLRDELTRWART